MNLPYEFSLGDIVETDISINLPDNLGCISGRCKVYVVGFMRDCDGTPLYILSDLPVIFPTEELSFSKAKMLYLSAAKFVEKGYNARSLVKISHRELSPTLSQFFFGN